MFEEVELPLAFPVEVNLYEAMAYCRYLGRKDGCNYRLMREAEWHVASRKEGEREGDYNLNFRYHSPTPVGVWRVRGVTVGYMTVGGMCGSG